MTVMVGWWKDRTVGRYQEEYFDDPKEWIAKYINANHESGRP